MEIEKRDKSPRSSHKIIGCYPVPQVGSPDPFAITHDKKCSRKYSHSFSRHQSPEWMPRRYSIENSLLSRQQQQQHQHTNHQQLPNCYNDYIGLGSRLESLNVGAIAVDRERELNLTDVKSCSMKKLAQGYANHTHSTSTCSMRNELKKSLDDDEDEDDSGGGGERSGLLDHDHTKSHDKDQSPSTTTADVKNNHRSEASNSPSNQGNQRTRSPSNEVRAAAAKTAPSSSRPRTPTVDVFMGSRVSDSDRGDKNPELRRESKAMPSAIKDQRSGRLASAAATTICDSHSWLTGSTVNMSLSDCTTDCESPTCCSYSSAESTTAKPTLLSAMYNEQNKKIDHSIEDSFTVSVSEKLQMQDRHRKQVILSMALKQVIAGEHGTISIEECGCRSRSCSFGPARSLSKTAPAVATTSAAAAPATSSSSSSTVVPSHSMLFGERASDTIKRLHISEKFPESSSSSIVLDNLNENPLDQFIKLNQSIGENIVLKQGAKTRTLKITNKTLDEICQLQLQAYKQQQIQQRQFHARHPTGESTARQLNLMRHLITGDLPGRRDQLDELVDSNENSRWAGRNSSPMGSCCDNCELARNLPEAERSKSSIADSWSKSSQVQDSGELHQQQPQQQQQPSLMTGGICSAFGNKNNINNDNNLHLNINQASALDQCETNLEALIVESWLDDHPQFTHDYFIRKAPRQLVDDWLIANARVSNTNLSSQLDLRSISNISRPMSQISLSSHLRGSSWRGSESIVTATDAFEENDSYSPQFGQFIRPTRSNSQSAAGMASIRAQSSITPIRKISATDFETRTGSGFLRPMLSKTPDGRLTFLPPPTNSVTNRPPSTTNESTPAAAKVLTCRQDQQQQHQETTLRVTKKHDSNRSSIKLNPSSLSPISRGVTQQDVPTDLASLIDNNDLSSSSASNTTINSKTRVGTIRRHESESDEDDDDDEQSPDSDSPDSPSHDRGEVKMIFELVKNIYDDLDIRTLLYKILKNIAVLINADRSSLFLVCGGPNDSNRRLVSQLFNVDQDSTEVGEPDESITIPWGMGLVGYVAESGEAVNITDCYKDPRFTDAIDQRTGYLTRHMLCAPILDKRNEIVGVAQVINKRDGNPFSKNDEMKFKRYLQFCGIGLRNAQSYEQCQLENRRNQVLLDLARMVFEEQSTIEQVVHRIMLHTQSLLDCERCQVLLIDSGSNEHESLLHMPPASARCNNAGTTSATTDDHGASQSGAKTTYSKQTDWRPQCSQFNMTLTAEDDRDERASAECGAPSVPDVTREGYSEVETNADVVADGSDYLDQSKQQRQQQQSPRLFSLVFDLECDGNEDPVVYDSRRSGSTATDGGSCGGLGGPKKSRAFPINIGITGYVATTGETLNIENAHKHERFDPSVDEGSDFKHESILCMPIRNGQRQIIGVSQLINKKNGQPFNKNDEDLFEAFAIFCGLGIHNTLMYERVLKVMAKQRVTFEVLSYHATAPLEEAKKLSQEQIPSCFALNLASLKFNDFSLDDKYMLKSCLRFFLDLDLIRRFQIDQLVFCNWILSVQKNYRKVTYHPIVGGDGLKASPVRYHNWRHAFNVSQMMFAILVNTQICQSLGELETLALLIACLCHDLDHRGTNNSFQIKSASPLAELYSTSTMEHHHFDQCVMILNSQGNQILSNLSPEEYSRVIILLEEAILATDLANYFGKRNHFFQLVNSNQFDWRNDPSHRSLLRCMLMTACDVAAITKPWPVQKVVADLVMSEFYQQGDIEKNELKIQPIDMMNRDKMSELPSMQIGFIDSICAPIYTAFAKLFPHELASLLDGCLTNRNLWQQLADSNTRPDIPLINYLVCDNDGTRHDVGAVASTKKPSINVSFSKSEADIPKQVTIESDNTEEANTSSTSDKDDDSKLSRSDIKLPLVGGYLIGLSDTTELHDAAKMNSVKHEDQRKSF